MNEGAVVQAIRVRRRFHLFLSRTPVHGEKYSPRIEKFACELFSNNLKFIQFVLQKGKILPALLASPGEQEAKRKNSSLNGNGRINADFSSYTPLSSSTLPHPSPLALIHRYIFDLSTPLHESKCDTKAAWLAYARWNAGRELLPGRSAGLDRLAHTVDPYSM